LRELDASEWTLSLRKSSLVAQTRYLLYNGVPTRVPSAMEPIYALTSPLTRAIPIALLRDLCTTRSILHDESVQAFFERRFHRDIAMNIMSAYVHGIYGGLVSEWSVRSLFKRMWVLEQKHRSILLGSVKEAVSSPRSDQHLDDIDRFLRDASFISFQRGAQELTDRIIQKLSLFPNVEIEMGQKCTAIKTNRNGWEVSV
jgi:oxygen-dependent protoporphyrinogen oxidase